MTESKMSLLLDLYELTMANGYLKTGNADRRAVFDLFFRNNPDQSSYSIFAGIQDVLDYIENLTFSSDDIDYLRRLGIFDEDFLSYLSSFRFRGDVYAFMEGSIVYPNVNLITVDAPLFDAQIIETAILSIVNHQSLIATKANRMRIACQGRAFSDFGARRSHGLGAALYGAKASYLGGANSTATVLAGKMFGIPVSGTMAHSFVEAFESEYEAFKAYSDIYPNDVVLLIDTYDVLKSGIENAIKLAKDYLNPKGLRLKGVRIDSGDLAYLSKKCRRRLDEEGLEDCKIIASNALDENKITSLIDQGAEIDSFGIGENLITSRSSPVFSGVYKLVAIEENGKLVDKIKISEAVEKITTPGFKTCYRAYGKDGRGAFDYLSFHDEEEPKAPLEVIYPPKPWKKIVAEDVTFKMMHIKMMDKGKKIFEFPSLKEMRNRTIDEVDNKLWEEEKRFEFPHVHYLDFSKKLYEKKIELLKEKNRA